jgi:signal transduction histidine kinase
MSAREPQPALRRVPPWLIDVSLSTLVAAQAFLHLPGEPSASTPLGVAAAALPAGFLFLRRRHPFPVLALCVFFFVGAVLTGPMAPASLLATAVAMYAVAVQTDRRTTLLTALAVLVPVMGVTLIDSGANALEPLPVQAAVTIGFAAALGEGVRIKRAYLAEMTARALHAEATRESEASRRVAEERLRIARDLHDVVAHQITVISLNAGVASSSLDTRPDAAREALATIRTAARRVLGEIGGLLAVLRSEDETLPGPQPGLAQLDVLTEDFATSGLKVGTRIGGDITSIDSAVDVVAYRVLQEALTNALKHGTGGRAHVLIENDRDNLHIVVTNPSRDSTTMPATTTAGHGLQGIEERAASVSGNANIEKSGGTFRVEVTLPVNNAADAQT